MFHWLCLCEDELRIFYMWLFYRAKKCYNNWSQLRSLTFGVKHSISLTNVCDITNAFNDSINSIQDVMNWILDTGMYIIMSFGL